MLCLSLAGLEKTNTQPDSGYYAMRRVLCANPSGKQFLENVGTPPKNLESWAHLT